VTVEFPDATTPRRLGPHTTVAIGVDGGRHPAGNSVFVQGSHAAAVIDPSTAWLMGGPMPNADVVLLTHAHEDHLFGVHCYPDAEIRIHRHDKVGLESLDGLMTMYGLDEAADEYFRRSIVDEYNYVPRPDATVFEDGDIIDLGGVTIQVVHLPGHTRGHSGFLIEPDGVLVTGDIDLSTFGPYYGDAWSDLDDFESSLVKLRDIDARYFATFHHKGVVDNRESFLVMLEAFKSVIDDRENRMVDFASTPKRIDDFIRHRFVYRPDVQTLYVDSVERRSASMSITRLVSSGRLSAEGDDTWVRSTRNT
jgi:glyoxylase-like metal-dependent hydrolase (beta-lactamase superfamily II)